MNEPTHADALIIDAVRTPIGRYAGALSLSLIHISEPTRPY